MTCHQNPGSGDKASPCGRWVGNRTVAGVTFTLVYKGLFFLFIYLFFFLS